jgi:subtilisin family serine protease
MRRRISLLVLAALLTLPVVGPVRAAEPFASPAPSGPVATEPTPTPSVDPTLSIEPAPSDAATVPEATATPDEPVPPTDEPAPSEPPAPSTEATPIDEPSPDAGPTESDPATPDDETAAPAPDPSPVPAGADDSHGRPDATGRYIVILASDAETATVVERASRGKAKGLKADRTFSAAVRGFTARLDRTQRTALEADPAVVAVVPDEVIELAAQTIPTGVSRIGTKTNKVAKINGIDERVDADVAIVDTGIQPNHPDLNVVGGYNCSTTTRTAWRDVQGHGTHVAGTVAAIDNGIGVVGVAPGARLWAVKILNDDGYGLLSWYVCGLDWIAAQRDANDSSRPLIEAVNMSVVKTGKDDVNCGNTNNDILHKAICRVTKAGTTVVAAAGNDSASAASRVPAAYNEVITVSALADTDGIAGGLGGNRCYSWGSYDRDDTFADFSNYGSDVDIIAPGKCIWSTKPGSTYAYSSGTSMATPAVTGAVALYKASRPKATPAEVREALMYLGNTGWSTSTDPDSYHERLLDVSKLGSLGAFSLADAGTGYVGENGGSTSVPIAITRSATFFERVRLSVSNVPSGWSAYFDTTSLLGWSATAALLNVTVPDGTESGIYTLTITATNQGRTDTTTARVSVGSDLPQAHPPSSATTKRDVTLNSSTAGVVVAWPAATDLSSTIAGYQFQYSYNDGAWTGTTSTSSAVRHAVKNLVINGLYRFRVRAVDGAGNWSTWAPTSHSYRVTVVNDRASGGALSYAGTWSRVSSASGTSGTITSTQSSGANVTYTFTGRGIAVVAPRSPTRSWFEVRIDGAYVGTVSLGGVTLKHRQVVFSKSWTTSGKHTINLRVVTSSSRKLASLDALVVTR